MMMPMSNDEKNCPNVLAVVATGRPARISTDTLFTDVFTTYFQVLHGNVNLLDKVDELKQRSAATKQELEVQRRMEEEQKRRLKELALQNMDTNQKYSSLEVRLVGGCRHAGDGLNMMSACVSTDHRMSLRHRGATYIMMTA